jgi:hypothetical protein
MQKRRIHHILKVFRLLHRFDVHTLRSPILLVFQDLIPQRLRRAICLVSLYLLVPQLSLTW